MAKNTINKKLAAGLLALSGAFILASCDPVEAVPTNYNTPILYGENNEAVLTNDNIMGTLYEAIASGKDSKALDIIMEELVNKKYGKKVTFEHAEEGFSTLTEIESCDDDTKKLAYVNSHAEMFVRDGDTDATKIARFNHFVDDIHDRINKEFYSLIQSAEYQDDDKMFDEQKLIDDLAKKWDLRVDLLPTDFSNKFYITAEVTKDNILFTKQGVTPKLQKAVYLNPETQEIGRKLEGSSTVYFYEQARGYIEKKIFPKILKDKLVEEYILNTESRTLGNASARKVNYVKVPYTINNMSYVKSIIDQFNDDYIYDSTAPEQIPFEVIDYAMVGFDKLNPGHFNGSAPLIKISNAVVGEGNVNSTYVDDSSKAIAYNDNFYKENVKTEKDQKLHKIVNVTVLDNNEVKSEFKTVDNKVIFDKDFAVYGDTELGKLLDSYNKAIAGNEKGRLATTEEKEELAKFQGGDSLADTLRDKIIDLAKTDNTNDGWVVKNGGASELPSSIRDRLFRLNVATEFEDFFKETDGKYGNYRYVDGNATEGKLVGSIPYARNINGKKLIMASDAADWETNNDNFVRQEGNAFYICQVLEAASNSKLDENSKSCYKKVVNEVEVADTEKIEVVKREIAKVLSTKESYATKAYTEYLQEYAFEFGDTSMYEYLKGQYPDLDIFDED